MAKKAARKKKAAKRSRAKADIRIKRAYESPGSDDGLRILIDRPVATRPYQERTQA